MLKRKSGENRFFKLFLINLCPSGNRHFWSKSGFIITAHEYIFIIHQNNAGLYDSIMR